MGSAARAAAEKEFQGWLDDYMAAWRREALRGLRAADALQSAFCPTGQGGGVDPSCSPGGGGGGGNGKGGAKPPPKGLVRETTLGGGTARQSSTPAAREEVKGFFGAAKAKLSDAGKAVYDKLPRPAQKVVDVAVKIEHGAEGFYKDGQALAREVARGSGLSDAHVDRVGRILSYADTVSRWGINWQAAHAILEPIGGPVLAFAGAKASYYFPAASYAYVGAKMLGATVKGKDPVALVRGARERVKAAKAKEAAHAAVRFLDIMAEHESSPDAARRQFALDVTRWLDTVPEEGRDYAEALLAAALDETRGDLAESLKLAQAEYQRDPKGGE